MILSIIFILLIIFGIGLPLVLLILPKQNLAITLGLSYPLGIGIFTLAMFFTNIVGFRFSLLNEFLLLFLISIPLVLLKNKAIKEFSVAALSSVRKTEFAPVEKVTLGVMAFLLVTSFINTFYWPVHIWDSVVLYDYRGHVFAITGYLQPALTDQYYIHYPLLTSLAHSIVYLSGGRYPQFIHSLYYLSFGLAFFGLLREFVSRKASFIFTLMLLIAGPIFYHSTLSLTNLSYSVYLAMGAISIYHWDKLRDRGYLMLSALMLGLSTWTRSNEPLWAGLLMVVFLASIYRRRVLEFALFSVIFFPIREIWISFQKFLAGANAPGIEKVVGNSGFLPAVLDIGRWEQVFTYLYKNVVVPWGAIFVAFILSAVLTIWLKKTKKLFLAFFITFSMLTTLFVGTLGLSVVEEDWLRIGDAVQRLSMFFYPLFLFYIALAVQELVNLKK